MATIDEWATFLSGNYQGWIRPPAGVWEDLIGSVKLAFAAAGEGCLSVTITSLEFGTWIGSLQLQGMVMRGSTGQGDTYFEFAFQGREQEKGLQGRFLGGIFAPPSEQLFEVNLASVGKSAAPA